MFEFWSVTPYLQILSTHGTRRDALRNTLVRRNEVSDAVGAKNGAGDVPGRWKMNDWDSA